MAENEILNSGLWFFSGAVCYKLGYWIFLNTYAFIFIESAIASALEVARYANENIEAAFRLVHNESSKSMSEEELQELKQKNELFLNIWRHQTINALLKYCTPYVRQKITFNNWFQAMDYLDKRGNNKL